MSAAGGGGRDEMSKPLLSKPLQPLAREERNLNAYHDGELSAVARWWFERRLARSPELRAELQRLEQLGGWLRESEIEPASPDLWSAIELRLPAADAQREPATEAVPSPWATWFRPVAALGATAALALAVVLGIIGDRGAARPGVISWLDTGGRSVMVLESGDDATIVWLLDGPARGAALRRSSEAV